MVKLIVFDLDGTLIDSRMDLAGAVNHMRGSMGLEPLTAERIVSFVGNGVGNLVRRAIADSDIDFEEALRRMKAYYAVHLVDTTTLYPGVRDGLRQLAERGITLTVLSNKPQAASTEILRKLNVAEYFAEIVGGDSAYPLKPAPDALVALRERFAATDAECWMVGDHYTDLEAGRRAGFHRALVGWGFGDARGEEPEIRVATFAELVEKLGSAAAV